MHLTTTTLRYMSNQTRWLSRTVMVKENNIDDAMKILNGIMANEGLMQRWKLTRRYETPTKARNRINYERTRAIYNEDMQNKIKFIMRKNRKDPYPGTV